MHASRQLEDLPLLLWHRSGWGIWFSGVLNGTWSSGLSKEERYTSDTQCGSRGWHLWLAAIQLTELLELMPVQPVATLINQCPRNLRTTTLEPHIDCLPRYTGIPRTLKAGHRVNVLGDGHSADSVCVYIYNSVANMTRQVAPAKTVKWKADIRSKHYGYTLKPQLGARDTSQWIFWSHWEPDSAN